MRVWSLVVFCSTHYCCGSSLAVARAASVRVWHTRVCETVCEIAYSLRVSILSDKDEVKVVNAFNIKWNVIRLGAKCVSHQPSLPLLQPSLPSLIFPTLCARVCVCVCFVKASPLPHTNTHNFLSVLALVSLPSLSLSLPQSVTHLKAINGRFHTNVTSRTAIICHKQPRKKKRA